MQEQRLRDTLRASEEERRRWARELHDETLQGLGALRMLLSSARRSGDPERLDAAVADAVENRLNSGRDRGGGFLIGQVGRPDNPRHSPQCRISQFVLVDQGFQGAASASMTELGPADVEWNRVDAAKVASAGHELEDGLGIDEPPDCPGGRDPIHVDALTGHNASVDLVVGVGPGGQLEADALAVAQTAVDGRGSFRTTRSAKVVAIANLPESALQCQQFPLRASPPAVVVGGSRMLG